MEKTTSKQLNDAQLAAIKVLRAELAYVSTDQEPGVVIGMFWNFYNQINRLGEEKSYHDRRKRNCGVG